MACKAFSNESCAAKTAIAAVGALAVLELLLKLSFQLCVVV